ncbi:AfsR/SARP family transcriptional regulator [Arthrobacter sp. SAFR-014]|uniref:AfsR/SARP family transcriptional regulator n=1 Tax=unclassified Arthrobacter TaxID=235627 RepID=UPI003F7C59AD
MEQDGAHFQLKLLQRWQLFCGPAEIHVPSRQQRLVSALALIGPRPRRYLSGLLWPDSPEVRALESLRVSVHLMSRQSPGLIVADGPILSLTNSLSVDLHQFLDHLRACELSESCSAPDGCLSQLQRAELLPGWYEDWVVLEQNRLRNIRLRALVLHAGRWLEQGEAAKAAEAAQNALELEPLHETSIGFLMHAELELGNRPGALHVFESFKALLAAELGVQPSRHLSRLAQRIRV